MLGSQPQKNRCELVAKIHTNYSAKRIFSFRVRRIFPYLSRVQNLHFWLLYFGTVKARILCSSLSKENIHHALVLPKRMFFRSSQEASSVRPSVCPFARHPTVRLCKYASIHILTIFLSLFLALSLTIFFLVSVGMPLQLYATCMFSTHPTLLASSGLFPCVSGFFFLCKLTLSP